MTMEKTETAETERLAEISDLAWAFVKDRFPQPEARERLAAVVTALLGGSYHRLGD